jgi:hypothetical protein
MDLHGISCWPCLLALHEFCKVAALADFHCGVSFKEHVDSAVWQILLAQRAALKQKFALNNASSTCSISQNSCNGNRQEQQLKTLADSFYTRTSNRDKYIGTANKQW